MEKKWADRFSTIRVWREDFDQITKAILKLQAKEGRRIAFCEMFHRIVQGEISIPELLKE